MGTRTALMGFVAAGAVCALLAPTAMAATGTTSPTSSTSATPTTTAPALKPVWITASPNSGRPGTAVLVDTNCTSPSSTSLTALDFFAQVDTIDGKDGPVWRSHGVVRDVPPGVYRVSIDCQGGPNHTSSGKASTTFTVLPKAQVPTRPVGAPQTGGGFTATDFTG
ncbi:hypothetical protein [Kutzneria chonburiensis]|uniref:Secreted protein n=1 Tax=Kutzneria chonburiensis TaxID=1483604 RepID=A0ABV6MUF9_9PSEU|nr:hypothetical protein [Kutzneria chonburiensis]